MMNALLQMPDFRQARADWRMQRPMGDFGLQQMIDWRQAMPMRQAYNALAPGMGIPLQAPVMTPGGGMTGAPLQGNPTQQVGMIPGVPGSMGLNPQMLYRLPTY